MHNVIERIKADSHLPVIIFGAGGSGQVLLQAIQEQDIAVECFCDDNVGKGGTVLQGIDVYHTSKIKDMYPDANIVISAADIHDMIDHLKHRGYEESRLHSAVPFLKDFNLSTFKGLEKYNEEDNTDGFVKFAVDCTVACQQGFGSPDKVFMRSVDIVVTERCSMKCRDCSNLMQFFENPINYNAEDMSEAIDLVAAYADEIHEFRVIGGEPFMNKDWHLVMETLISKSNVKRIAIYTNGTIIPKEHQLECLKNDKVIFMITDYSGCGDGGEVPNQKTERLGRFKTSVDKLEDLCKEHGIDYRRHPPENWTDCGRIEEFNRTDEENKEVFRSCCCKNLITLSEGELHRCPFSAQITRLGVCNEKEDYVNVTEDLPADEMKHKLRSFLFEKDFIKACDYCPGRRLSDPHIKPAVQTDKTMPVGAEHPPVFLLKKGDVDD